MKNTIPAARRPALEKAIRLEWLTIVYLFSAIAFIAATMGQSQAMKTAWFDDALSLIPAFAFLISEHIRKRPRNREFPFGFNRIISIAFLIAATALFLMGVYLLIDAATKLISGDRPSIGTMNVFGHTIWAGWIMMVATVWSGLPAYFLGRAKRPLALEVHNKVLYADATMARADWLVAAAAIVGLAGLGLGFWWADAAAAIFISFDILKEGLQNLKNAISDLIDQVPTVIDGTKEEPLVAQVKSYFKSCEWIENSTVRFRENGHLFAGEAFIVPKSETDLISKVTRTLNEVRKMDWRLQSISITPVTNDEFSSGRL